MLQQERGRELLYLSRADIEALRCTPADVLECVEAAFREKASGRAEMPPKPGVHPRPDCFLHAMPAYLPGLDAVGMKWVAGYPHNRSRNLPYITGLVVLNCPDTGVVLAVMDCTWITEKRTAAATAAAVRRLAVAPRRLAILGAGVQGRANTEALRAVFDGLEEVAVYDPDRAATERFAETLSTCGLSVVRVAGPSDAVRGADIVVSCAPIVKHPKPVIAPEWMKSGSVGVSLDFDASFRAETARAVDQMWVDDAAQYEYYRVQGYFSGMPDRCREVAELIVGAAGRSDGAERHLVVNLGLALEDVCTALMLYRRALKCGVGTDLRC